MQNKLYALVTTNCNLHCPHCDIKDRFDGYDRDKFIKELNSFDGDVILFGGEPTLYQDRLFDINENNTAKNIKSISTNLINLDDKLINFYKSLDGGIATSWNPNRFSVDQYQLWLDHLTIMAKNNLNCAVLITLTNDLFELGTDKFIALCHDWNPNAIQFLKFEYYVGDTNTTYYERADQFLCEIYNKWDLDIEITNISSIIHGYCFDCSNIYTLSPDGKMSLGCPHGYNPKVPIECYSCEKVDKCKPCRLQPYCSFPHNFEKLVKGAYK